MKEITMPHINIKHFPVALADEQRTELVTAITDAVTKAFEVPEGAVSIALEPVEQTNWNEQVYTPEIIDRGNLLCKLPNY
jgi:phenylpyruvate tautomerase PptA (4-oxalocrotonate tautomerase family)